MKLNSKFKDFFGGSQWRSTKTFGGKKGYVSKKEHSVDFL